VKEELGKGKAVGGGGEGSPAGFASHIYNSAFDLYLIYLRQFGVYPFNASIRDNS